MANQFCNITKIDEWNYSHQKLNSIERHLYDWGGREILGSLTFCHLKMNFIRIIYGSYHRLQKFLWFIS